MLNTTLYFSGTANSVSPKLEDFLIEHNYSRLGSQLNDRAVLNYWMKAKQTNPDLKLFVDSGAYSMYTLGKTVDIPEYAEYLNKNGQYFDCMASVDVIPGNLNVNTDRTVYLSAP